MVDKDDGYIGIKTEGKYAKKSQILAIEASVVFIENVSISMQNTFG